jgi:GH35 family endo-1,4-beta-xylanase
MARNSKSLKSKKIIGIVFISLIMFTFLFLLVSPIMPNYFGKIWDDKVFHEAQENIENIRKGTIRMRFINSTTGDPITNTSVNATLVNHEFLFGAMFFHYDETSPYNTMYASMWTDVFNFAILPFYYSAWENATYYPEENRINNSIAYLDAHGITNKKGHCIVWNHPAGVPEWLNIDNMTKQEIIDHYNNRITTLTQKYRHNISYWDVTNEMVHRGFPKMDNLQDFVVDCFTTARTAVPSNNLIFNDYGMLGHSFGIGEMETFFSQLIEQGTPFDIIGMQDHLMDTDWTPTYEIKGTLDGFGKLGKPIHITEIMVSSYPAPITNSWKKGIWSEELQAEFLERMYTTAFGNEACESLLYWGFEDRETDSSRFDGYGLVHADMTPKPAYNTLKRLIKEQWHTELSNVHTDSNGWVEFNGFFGTYNLTIDNQDFQISAQKNGDNTFVVQLV